MYISFTFYNLVKSDGIRKQATIQFSMYTRQVKRFGEIAMLINWIRCSDTSIKYTNSSENLSTVIKSAAKRFVTLYNSKSYFRTVRTSSKENH